MLSKILCSGFALIALQGCAVARPLPVGGSMESSTSPTSTPAGGNSVAPSTAAPAAQDASPGSFAALQAHTPPSLGFTAPMAAAADAMSRNLSSPAVQASMAKAGYHQR